MKASLSWQVLARAPPYSRICIYDRNLDRIDVLMSTKKLIKSCLMVDLASFMTLLFTRQELIDPITVTLIWLFFFGVEDWALSGVPALGFHLHRRKSRLPIRRLKTTQIILTELICRLYGFERHIWEHICRWFQAPAHKGPLPEQSTRHRSA